MLTSILGKYVLPFVLGLMGMIVALTAWHVYNDHVTFHRLVNALVAQQQQRQNEEPDQ